jgi:hypothetical protein
MTMKKYLFVLAFALLPSVTMAAQLNETQINAILGLLRAFMVPDQTIALVRSQLEPSGMSVTTPISSTAGNGAMVASTTSGVPTQNSSTTKGTGTSISGSTTGQQDARQTTGAVELPPAPISYYDCSQVSVSTTTASQYPYYTSFINWEFNPSMSTTNVQKVRVFSDNGYFDGTYQGNSGTAQAPNGWTYTVRPVLFDGETMDCVTRS